MNLAQRAWEDAYIGRLSELRRSAARANRGHRSARLRVALLVVRCHSELLTLKGHASGVTSVASVQTASASRAAAVTTRSRFGTQPRPGNLTLKGHGAPSGASPTVPTTGRIASGSEDKTLKVWDAATGRETLALKGHTMEVLRVAFSPDGKRIASGSGDNTLRSGTRHGPGNLILKGHSRAVTRVAFSPDGKHIASGSLDNTLKLWDAARARKP